MADNFDLTAVPRGREDIARMIIDAFANAGFGTVQQAAAVAVAVVESDLNPNAASEPPDDSIGLFQLNRRHGLGVGHTKEELMDPGVNIAVTIAEAKKQPSFASAESIEDAVTAFVRRVERPMNVDAEIAKSLKIAQKLLPAI